MSIFKGHFASAVQENHQFFCDEKLILNTVETNGINFGPNNSVKLLKVLVLTSFTRSSCSTIFNDSIKYLRNAGLNQTFTRLTPNQTIINNAGGTCDSATYTAFDIATKKYETAKRPLLWPQIEELITYHENRQFDKTFPKNESLEKLLKDINTSLEQGVIIKCKVLHQTDFVYFKLNFFNRNSRSNAREIATPTNTVYAGVPSTPYGQTYSYSNTTNFQSSSTSNIGSLTPANPNDRFGQNAVSAPLRMHFDPNSNTYEAGTAQMLARLLTDVDPAPITNLPEDILDGKVPANPQEVIDATTPHTIGEAIPLTMQNGNPNTFGPDYLECGDKKLIKLKVINRSKEEYKKDSVVIVSRINNEWIIIKSFGTAEPIEPIATVGEWTFSKLIANSDNYFKYDSFFSAGTLSTNVSESTYQSKARSVFYSNLGAVLANTYQNIYTPAEITQIIKANTPSEPNNFVPTKRYIISSIFDQLPPEMGGFAENKYLDILYNNNVKFLQTPDSATNDGLTDVSATPSFFWGPLFSQGYSSVSVDYTTIPSGNDVPFFRQATMAYGGISPTNDDEAQANLILFLKDKLVNEDNPNNFENLLQFIPAEMTSKTLNSIYLYNNWSNMGKNYTQFDILQATRVIKPPYYKSIGKYNSVQFSPISLEFVGNRYEGVDNEGSSSLGSVTLMQASETLVNSMSQYDESYPFIHGAMFNRARKYGGATEGENTLKLLCLVNHKNPSPPLHAKGAPNLFMPKLDNYNCGSVLHVGSNIVGITAAKTTVAKRGNNININFSVRQNFGSLVNRQVSPGQAPTVTILPIGGGIGWSTPGVDPSVRSYPTWGSSQDDPSSFGTLALHVKVFDSWPEEQTIFDPRYFAVLHFSAGQVGVPPTSGIPVGGNSNVDFTIPTGSGGVVLRTNTPITSSTPDFSITPIKNTIRRGQLLSGVGFWYHKHFVGLNEYVIVDAGTGFKPNTEITIEKGAIIIPTVGGSESGLSSFSFKQINTEDAKYTARGTNVVPSDFSTQVSGNNFYVVNIPSPTAGGRSAIVHFKSGIVYTHFLRDAPPKEYTQGPTRLTDSSNRGNGNETRRMGPSGFVVGTKETSVSLTKNASNTYDCFFHFHNDAGLYYLNEYNAPVQHIILDIS